MPRRTALCVCAALVLAASSAFGATARKDGNNWIIETNQYSLTFKTAAQAGYIQATPTGSKSLLGGGAGRHLYHSGNYAGWKDWGPATSVEKMEEGGGKVVMKYVMDDGGSKFFHLTATYWDAVPYFKHEVVVEAKANVRSFQDGHDPMVEPVNGAGADNKYQVWTTPIQHVAMANANGFFALYTEKGTARSHVWQTDGRMDLVHDALAQDLTTGQKSAPAVFYIAVGKGTLADANALASRVLQAPTPVEARGKTAATWGDLKTK